MDKFRVTCIATKSYEMRKTWWWAMQQIEMCEKQEANSPDKKSFVFLNFQLIIASDKEFNSPARYSFAVCASNSALNSFLCPLTIRMNRKLLFSFFCYTMQSFHVDVFYSSFIWSFFFLCSIQLCSLLAVMLTVPKIHTYHASISIDSCLFGNAHRTSE